MAALYQASRKGIAAVFEPVVRGLVGGSSMLDAVRPAKTYPRNREIRVHDMRFPPVTQKAPESTQRAQETPAVILAFSRSPVGNGEPKGGCLAQVNPIEMTISLAREALQRSGIDALYQQSRVTAEQMTHAHGVTMPTGMGEQPGMQIAHGLFVKANIADHGLPSRDVNVMCSGGGRGFLDVHNALQSQGTLVGIVTAFEVPSQSSHGVVASRRDTDFPDADVRLTFSNPDNLQAGGKITLNEGYSDERTLDFKIIQKNNAPYIQFQDGKKTHEMPCNTTYVELKNKDGYRSLSDELMWQLAADDAKRFSQTYLITKGVVEQLSTRAELFGGDSEDAQQAAAQRVADAFIVDQASGIRTITRDQLQALLSAGVLTEEGVQVVLQKPLLTREQLDRQAVKEIIRAVTGMKWTADEMGDVKTQQGAPVSKMDQALIPYAVMLKTIPEDQWENTLLALVQKAKPLRQGEGEILTLYHCSRVSDGAAALVMAALSFVEEHSEIADRVQSRVLYSGDTAIEEAGMTNFGFLKAIDTGLMNAGIVKEDGTPDYMRVDQWEIHEPFTVTLSFLRNILAERGLPPEIFDQRVNIHGSSGRIGHPPALTELRKIGTLSGSLKPGQIGLSVVGAAGANHIVTVLQAPLRDKPQVVKRRASRDEDVSSEASETRGEQAKRGKEDTDGTVMSRATRASKTTKTAKGAK